MAAAARSKKQTTDVASRYPRSVALKGGASVDLRLMTPADVDLVHRFAKALPANDLLFLRRNITDKAAVRDWANEIQSGEAITVLAMDGETMAGYANLNLNRATWMRHLGEIRLLTASTHRGSGVGPGAKGWHSNGILGPIAAACAAGKALDLSGAQILTAIGLAAGSCGALTRDGGTMAKPYRTGHAAVTGMTCALLAKSGFTADDTVLEGRFGLLEALGPIDESIVASLATELGRRYNLQSPIRGKRYASCSASHTGLEAMLRLRRKHGISPEQVAAIECDLKPYPLVRTNPSRGVEGRFSMPFVMALGLIHDGLPSDGFTDRNVSDPAVRRLMGCTRHMPGAEVLVVTLTDGRKFEEPVRKPTDLTSWDDIAAKFRVCVSGILTPAQIDSAVDGVKNLEQAASARSLGAALVAEPQETRV